jgi:hypothetical protein
LIEAGLLSPIFLFFFMALAEYGYAAGAYLNVSSAVGEGLRVASVMGSAPTADYEIIQSIDDALEGRPDISVEKIVVFKSADGDDEAPVACTAGTTRTASLVTVNVTRPDGTVVAVPAPGACNGYTGPLDFGEPLANAHFYGCGAPRHAAGDNRSRGYCPNDRISSFANVTSGTPSAINSGPDYIGVYVRYKHELVTGFFGEDITFEVQSITRIEPTEVGT